MTLSNQQKLQIFCAALTASAQPVAVNGFLKTQDGVAAIAGKITAEAIAEIMRAAWLGP